MYYQLADGPSINICMYTKLRKLVPKISPVYLKLQPSITLSIKDGWTDKVNYGVALL